MRISGTSSLTPYVRSMGRGAGEQTISTGPLRREAPTYHDALLGGLTIYGDMLSVETGSVLLGMFGGRDFCGIVDVEYETDYDGATTARVTEAIPMQMIHACVRYNGLAPQQELITAYALERLTARHELGPEDLTSEVDFGYYDEQEGAVKVNHGFIERAEPWALEIEATDGSLAAVTKKLLELENGHLLPELADAEYSIEELDLDDVVLPSHLRRETLSEITFERHAQVQRMFNGWLSAKLGGRVGERIEEDLRVRCPVGVVTFKDGVYRLVDGYHRNAGCREAGRLHEVPYIVATSRSE